MIGKIPPVRVWKRTARTITHELIEEVIKEIEGKTAWPHELIRRRLLDHKDLIRVPGAEYHLYRDSLG